MNKIKKYINEAQERAKRRKSPWNLILIPIGIAGTSFFYYIQFNVLWSFHVYVYPNHSGRLSEFWREGGSATTFISSFLLATPIFFSSLVLGMMMANVLLWFVPPIRKIFENEARGIKGVLFSETMKSLGKVALYVVPTCFLLGLIGAVTLKSFQ